MQPVIAFATFRDLPYGDKDDGILIEGLRAHNIDVETPVWDDPDVDWRRYSVVLPRSTWDYHHKVDAFRAWIKRLSKQQIRLFNAPETIMWNMNKRYLQELEQTGIPVLPSIWPEAEGTVSLEDLLTERGWEKAVIKPVISAGGDNTWTVTRDNAAQYQAKFNALRTNPGVMIQRFSEGIQQGEWSFIFLDGQFSHALVKRPAEGNFLIHEHFGGTNTNMNPTLEQLDETTAVLRYISHITEETPLYARVDGVYEAGQFYLMELELIEPGLYMAFSGTSHRADLFVKRLVDTVLTKHDYV